MAEDTVIYNAEPDEENNDSHAETQNQENFKDTEENSEQGNTGNYVKIGAASILGLAGGVLGSHYAFGESPFTGAEEKDTEIDILVDKSVPIATTVKDSMPFEEAFETAKEEIGAGGLFEWNGEYYGTYSRQEWEDMGQTEQDEFWGSFSINPYNIEDTDIEYDYSNLEMATSVNDDMTFGEAFAAARAEHGSSAVFEWHGMTYGTYYKEEWDDLSPEAQDQFTDAAIQLNDAYQEQLANVPDFQDLENDILASEPVEDFDYDGDVYEADLDENYLTTDYSDQQEIDPSLIASAETGASVNDEFNYDNSANDELELLSSEPVSVDELQEAEDYYEPDYVDSNIEQNEIDIVEPNAIDKLGNASAIGEMGIDVLEGVGIDLGGAGEFAKKIFKFGRGADDVNDAIKDSNDGLDVDNMFSIFR